MEKNKQTEKKNKVESLGLCGIRCDASYCLATHLFWQLTVIDNVIEQNAHKNEKWLKFGLRLWRTFSFWAMICDATWGCWTNSGNEAYNVIKLYVKIETITIFFVLKITSFCRQVCFLSPWTFLSSTKLNNQETNRIKIEKSMNLCRRQ